MLNVTDSKFSRRGFLQLLALSGGAAALGLAGCAGAQSTGDSSAQGSSSDASTESSASAVAFDSARWSYDSDNDVYYQIGVQYCENPVAPTYESMGIYVPGAYFDAKKNSDGSYTCTPSSTGTVNGYTAATAPMVMPINTAGYSAQAAPTSYSASGITSYLQAGFVYAFAGCRGRKMSDSACGAAPWGVTDLKAAVRTLRLNKANLAGNTDRIFSFGHSGGGAQSAVLGASGDAPGYDDYLAAIGAPTVDADGNTLSDAIYGTMCWCPITNLDQADAAYEWNMGQFASSGTRAEGAFTRQLSYDLAESYADYINGLGLTSPSGEVLRLTAGGEGIFTSGTYYDYVKAQVEISLNNFLADTTWPYTPSNSFNADMGAGGGGQSGAPSGERPSGASSGSGPRSSSSGSRSSGSSSGSSTTYETAADYIAALNGDGVWIVYDEVSNTATITGLAAFVAACKSPSKSVGAFDAFDCSQAENEVFGDDEGAGLHFDATMAQLLEKNAAVYAKLENWDAQYPSDYADDRAWIDAQGKSCDFRQNLYNPMYYLCDAYEGAHSSTPAAHWRIRTGLTQGDTASTTEINLALALQTADAVEDVDFATVWGQGHTLAERTGSSTQNFIAWVQECCK